MLKGVDKLSNDIQKFINKFDPAKFKVIDYGIEVRGVKEIHKSLLEARELIQRQNLKLATKHNAGMLSYWGFEVKNTSTDSC